MKEKEEKRDVFLRAGLCSELGERGDGTDFGSGDEYLELVVEEMVDEEEEDWVFSEDGEREVRKVLKDLGYPD